ncbi:MAG TPA: cytochrome P460 family protein [Blastocatellia bacterium]|nr:cytochrome P460 family protein [Blastocatellia bacterium]
MKRTKLSVSLVFVVLLGCFAASSFSGLGRAAASSQSNSDAVQAERGRACGDALESNLPLPSSLPPDKYQRKLLDFLASQEYVKLKWCEDKMVRDTGPYIDGKYYGTHPAVRVFYSPEIMKWLVKDRKYSIPDGAMIIKEMYPGPAAKYQDSGPPKANDWTVMVKDSKVSRDGWYWGGYWTGTPMPLPSQSYKPPFSYPNDGFGLSCLHCHAAADKEFTFATLNNIKGFPGDPLTFFVDDWHTNANKPAVPPPPAVAQASEPEEQDEAPGHRKEPPLFKRELTNSPADFFKLLGEAEAKAAQPRLKVFPGETYDHVYAGPKGAEEFVTSDQCQICHSGNAWYGKKNLMILQPGTKDPVNVSPYGEWRWSPMGLAGRDPVFYSQFDSEMNFLKGRPGDAQTVTNTCFSCHGVMGKRQLDLDHGGQGGSSNFDPAVIYNTDLKDPNFKYGALARDGISCLSCHHIVEDKAPAGQDPLKYFLNHNITGDFKVGKRDEAYGPFKDKEVSPLIMKNALEVDPKESDYVKSSRLCGSCHTIKLPVLDEKPAGTSIEQATYLEWLNSQFQDEYNPGPNAQSCQNCHMANSYASAKNNVSINPIQAVIADVEDDTYPAAENRAPLDKIRVRYREKGFARHQFQGLNIFLLEFVNQFMTPALNNPSAYSNDILGLRKSDYMSTLNNDLDNAIDNFVQTAQNETATVDVTTPIVDKTKQALVTDVTVTNKTGHRFPSGVGFRRAFIAFEVTDKSKIDPKTGETQVVWASGNTNSSGYIVDNQGQVLETEYIGTRRDKGGVFQPHFYGPDHPITSSKQVQIYEELVKDASGDFTTSFVRRDRIVKENRLLPKGWSHDGPTPALSGEYLAATYPEGDAEKDPNYMNGSGTSQVRYMVPLSELPPDTNPENLEVRVTLYYQALPPYFLDQRFEQTPTAPATERLFYLRDEIVTDGTPIENWRLLVTSKTVSAP